MKKLSISAFFLTLFISTTVIAQQWQYNYPAFALKFPKVQPESSVGPLCAQYSIKACDDNAGRCTNPVLTEVTSAMIEVNSPQLIKSFNYISYYGQGSAVYQFLNKDPRFSANVSNIHSFVITDNTMVSNNGIGFPVYCSATNKTCYFSQNAPDPAPGYAGTPMLSLNLTQCPASPNQNVLLYNQNNGWDLFHM